MAAIMKSYTDLGQSKKLAGFLPLESADMIYTPIMDIDSMSNSGFLDIPECYSFNEFKDSHAKPLPCWSLAALLQVLPLGLYDEFDGCDYELEINMIDKMPRYIRLGDISHSKFPWDFEKDTLLDNIVESIIWLNDNNYFES